VREAQDKPRITALLFHNYTHSSLVYRDARMARTRETDEMCVFDRP